MSDRSRALACFIGEEAAGDAEPDGLHHAIAGCPADDFLKPEGGFEDHREGMRNFRCIHDENDQSAKHIGRRHQRDDLAGDRADRLDPPDDHREDQHRDQDTDAPGGK